MARKRHGPWEGSIDTCCICMEDFHNIDCPPTELPCGHWFHHDCVRECVDFNRGYLTCPLCQCLLQTNSRQHACIVRETRNQTTKEIIHLLSTFISIVFLSLVFVQVAQYSSEENGQTLPDKKETCQTVPMLRNEIKGLINGILFDPKLEQFVVWNQPILDPIVSIPVPLDEWSSLSSNDINSRLSIVNSCSFAYDLKRDLYLIIHQGHLLTLDHNGNQIEYHFEEFFDGVAYLMKEDVYVAHEQSKCTLYFIHPTEKRIIHKLSQRNIKNGNFQCVTCVFSFGHKLILSDIDNHVLKIIAGKSMKVYQLSGTEQFAVPGTPVAIGVKGDQLLVADSSNKQIVELDMDSNTWNVVFDEEYLHGNVPVFVRYDSNNTEYIIVVHWNYNNEANLHLFGTSTYIYKFNKCISPLQSNSLITNILNTFYTFVSTFINIFLWFPLGIIVTLCKWLIYYVYQIFIYLLSFAKLVVAFSLAIIVTFLLFCHVLK